MLAVTAMAAAGLLFLGCGGGGDEAPVEQPASEPVEPVITQSELIDEGNRICAEVNAAIGTIEASDSAGSTTLESQLATIYDGLADRLEDLGKPSDGAAPVAVISAARSLGQPGEGSAEELRQAADDYGLDECAEEPSAPDPSGVTDSDDGDSGGGDAPAPAPTPAPAPAPVAPSGGGGGSSGGGAGGPPSGGISPG